MNLSAVSDSLNLSNIINNCSMSKITFRPKIAKGTSLTEIKEDISEDESSDFLNTSNESPEKTNVEEQFRKQHHKNLKLTVFNSDNKHQHIKNDNLQNTTELETAENELKDKTLPVSRLKGKIKVKKCMPSNNEQEGVKDPSLQANSNLYLESASSFTQACNDFISPKEIRKKIQCKRKHDLSNEENESINLKKSKSHKEYEPMLDISSDDLDPFKRPAKVINGFKIKPTKDKLNNVFEKKLTHYETEFSQETPIKKINKSRKKKMISSNEQKGFLNTTENELISYAQSTPFNFAINNYTNKSKLSVDKLLVETSDKDISTIYTNKQSEQYSWNEFEPESNKRSCVQVGNVSNTIDHSGNGIDDIDPSSLQTIVSKCVQNEEEMVPLQIKSKSKRKHKNKAEASNRHGTPQQQSDQLFNIDNSTLWKTNPDLDVVAESTVPCEPNNDSDSNTYGENSHSKTVVCKQKIMKSNSSFNNSKLKPKSKKYKNKAKKECDIDQLENDLIKKYLGYIKQESGYFKADPKKDKLHETKSKRKIKSNKTNTTKQLISNGSLSDSSQPKDDVNEIENHILKKNTNEKGNNLKRSSTNENHEHLHKAKYKVKKKKKCNEIEIMRKQLILKALKSISDPSSIQSSEAIEHKPKKKKHNDCILETPLKNISKVDNLKTDSVYKNNEKLHIKKFKVKKRKHSNEIDIRKQLISNALTSIPDSSSSHSSEVIKKKKKNNINLLQDCGLNNPSKVENFKTDSLYENSENLHKTKLKVKKKKKINEIDIIRKQLLTNALVSLS